MYNWSFSLTFNVRVESPGIQNTIAKKVFRKGLIVES